MGRMKDWFNKKTDSRQSGFDLLTFSFFFLFLIAIGLVRKMLNHGYGDEILSVLINSLAGSLFVSLFAYLIDRRARPSNNQ